MKDEDVKIGMKVVPSKAAIDRNSEPHHIIKMRKDIDNFSFFTVYEKLKDGRYNLSVSKNDVSWRLYPEDFEPYIEPDKPESFYIVGYIDPEDDFVLLTEKDQNPGWQTPMNYDEAFKMACDATIEGYEYYIVKAVQKVSRGKVQVTYLE